MSWVKLDDKHWRNVKQLRMSDAQHRVWICSWSRCADQPEPSPYLAREEAEQLILSLRKPLRILDELVALNAWELTEDGIKVHDLELKREAMDAAERKRVERQRHAGSHDFPADQSRNGHADVTPMSRKNVTGVTDSPRPHDGDTRSPVAPVPVPEDLIPPQPPLPDATDQRLKAVHDWAYGRDPALTVNENVLVLRRIAREFDLPCELILRSLDAIWGGATEPPRSMRYFWSGLQEARSEFFKSQGAAPSTAETGFVRALA